jgi:hypothetical protein
MILLQLTLSILSCVEPRKNRTNQRLYSGL